MARVGVIVQPFLFGDQKPAAGVCLSPHHEAWLSAHPNRTAGWLKRMLKEGFDVHHLDGNHANNDPANLVLIEHMDHMMIHGGRTMGRVSPKGAAKRSRPPNATNPNEMAKLAYGLLNSGRTIAEVCREVGWSRAAVMRHVNRLIDAKSRRAAPRRKRAG